MHCFADTVSDFYPNDSHFSVSTWNIGAKASCASFFSSALFILKKMRKKTFRPDEKLTHNFETKQRHKDIMLVNSWVQIQQRATLTTKSHTMITRGFRPNYIVAKLWNQVPFLDHFVVQNSGDFLCWKYSFGSKGQLIWQWIFCVFKSPKNPTKVLTDFYPSFKLLQLETLGHHHSAVCSQLRL